MRRALLLGCAATFALSGCGGDPAPRPVSEPAAESAAALASDPLTWTADPSTGLSFATGLAIDGDTLAIGTPANLQRGDVHVYVRNGSGWLQRAVVTASDGADGDQFGTSIAIRGDQMIVGAPGKDVAGTDSGQIYVFFRIGSTWYQFARLWPSDAAAGQRLGEAVSYDANVVVASARPAGLAYVFGGSGATWSQQGRLTAGGGASDKFGASVAIHGGRILVGAPARDAVFGGRDSGAAWMFSNASGSWTLEQELFASDGGEDDGLGTSVAFDGTTALVGAPYRDLGGKAGAGAVYVFTLGGSWWSQDPTPILSPNGPTFNESWGQSVAVDGTVAVASAGNQFAYWRIGIFERGASGWVVGKHASTNFLNASAVALSGRRVVVRDNSTPTTYTGTRPDGQGCAGNADCTSAHCVDGVCCDTACGGGALDCQACSVAAGAPSDGTCAVFAATRVCRPAAGGCDFAETCDGSSPVCPADVRLSAGEVCRASAGACDVAETCDGSGVACPADAVAPLGVECRAAAGDCDIAETCDGVGPLCPDDVAAPVGATCRPASGPCDMVEKCDGLSLACPPDLLQPFSTVCRPASAGCDAVETCDGLTADCPDDRLAPAGFVCRASKFACDVEEVCDGATADCPPNQVAANGDPCDDGNACTQNDRCTGGSCGGDDTCSAPDAGADAATDAATDAANDGAADAARDGATDAAHDGPHDAETEGDADAPAAAGDAPPEDDGGCSASGRSPRGGAAIAAAWALLALAALRRPRGRRA